MRDLIKVFGMLLVGFSAASAGPPGRLDRSDEVQRLRRAAEVFNEIMSTPDKSIPVQLLEIRKSTRS